MDDDDVDDDDDDDAHDSLMSGDYLYCSFSDD